MNTLGAAAQMANRTAEERQRFAASFAKRRKVLEHYMGSAPGTKMKDKLTFVFGVGTTLAQAWYLGRFPHAFYYDYHCAKATLYLTGKWMYYKSRGWHYYMTDFCYFANLLLIIFLQL